MSAKKAKKADMSHDGLPTIWILKTKVGVDNDYNNAIYLAKEGIIGIGWSFIPYELRRIERDAKGYKRYEPRGILKLIETANLNSRAPSGKHDSNSEEEADARWVDRFFFTERNAGNLIQQSLEDETAVFVMERDDKSEREREDKHSRISKKVYDSIKGQLSNLEEVWQTLGRLNADWDKAETRNNDNDLTVLSERQWNEYSSCWNTFMENSEVDQSVRLFDYPMKDKKKVESFKELANRKGDFVVMHDSEGNYHIGRISDKSKWRFFTDDSHRAHDSCNCITNIQWVKQPIPPSMMHGTLASYFNGVTPTIRAVGGKQDDNKENAKGLFLLSALLYCFDAFSDSSELAGDELFEKQRDKVFKLLTSLASNEKTKNWQLFYAFLDPDGVEDLLAMLLMRKGYIPVPSTNKSGTKAIEFDMFDPRSHGLALVGFQVKNNIGKSSTQSDLKDPEDYDLLNSKLGKETTANHNNSRANGYIDIYVLQTNGFIPEQRSRGKLVFVQPGPMECTEGFEVPIYKDGPVEIDNLFDFAIYEFSKYRKGEEFFLPPRVVAIIEMYGKQLNWVK